jgi:hypothetical protein
MIEFECDGCHKLIRLNDDKAGRHGHCPHCQASVIVPESSVFVMHDEAFVESKPQVQSISSPSVNPHNAGSYSNAVVWAKNALAWVFGLLFFLVFLVSVWRYPVASIPVLLAAVILTPAIYQRLRSLFNFELDVQLKVVASLVLFVAYMVLYGIGTSNEASEHRRIAEQQAEQARQSERDETIRYLQAN